MKKLIVLIVLLSLFPFLSSQAAQAAEEKEMTLLVYLCGSNLESEFGSATADIEEMTRAGADPDKTGVLVMTGGSTSWKNNLEADKVCITEISGPRSRVVKRFDSMSMGSADTLAYFIEYAMEYLPAKDYAMIIWDHGTGPLGGVCQDEIYTPDSLSLQEITRALEEARLPRKLKWIGFDACLMSTAEVASAVSPYADYMIASQDKEPATGWNYAFLSGLHEDKDTVETAKRIIDLYMETPVEKGVLLTLSCVDLSRMDALVSSMDRFFLPVSKTVNKDSFSRLSGLRQSSSSFGTPTRGVGVDGYDLVDLKDLVAKMDDTGFAQPLLDILDNAVVYSRPALDSVSGLSVYHPYYNKKMFQANWAADYRNLAFCPGYSRYIDQFGRVLLSGALADWSSLTAADKGFDADGGNWFSMQLTPEQQASFSSAQLLVLCDSWGGMGDKFRETSGIGQNVYQYSPVLVTNAAMDENGLVTASFTGRALYVTDGQGNALAGPLAYRLSADEQTYYILGRYLDQSGAEDSAATARVMFACGGDECGGAVDVRDAHGGIRPPDRYLFQPHAAAAGAVYPAGIRFSVQSKAKA